MFRTVINQGTLFSLRILYHIYKKINIREFNARKWSNDELRKFANLFSGQIINVSAGEDKDKEGDFYKNYFKQASSYSISNYRKLNDDDIELDLNVPISNGELLGNFDVVFSHTVLEHVYNLKIAIGNLCALSNDIVITVVPFLQAFHHEEDIYHDYWRISPYALVQLFNENSFKTLYINWNNDYLGNIYIFCITSKVPEKWKIIREMCSYCRYGPGYFRQTLLSNSNILQNSMIKKWII